MIPNSTLELLKLREGFRTQTYFDTRGFPTVGLGHLLTGADKAKYPVGKTVPAAVLTEWMKADTMRAYAAALQQASILGVADQRFIDVLTSVNFQLGTGWRIKWPVTCANLRCRSFAQVTGHLILHPVPSWKFTDVSTSMKR